MYSLTATDGTIVHVSEEDLLDGTIGYCVACGEEARAEPDAYGYRCESCDARAVYGTEALVISGALSA